ncbi:MAG: hypothetical protein ACO1O6_12355 [Bacteroidota bacterium]
MKSKRYRKIVITIKQGIDGSFNEMEKDGSNLRGMLQSDPEALQEFESAMRYKKKAKVNNAGKMVSLVGALGLTVACAMKYSREKSLAGAEETEYKISKGVILLGAGALAGFGGIFYFPAAVNKSLDNFLASIRKSIDIYNQNLLEKALD